MVKLKCKKCKRSIPNKKYLTKNGCIWCDSKYRGEK